MNKLTQHAQYLNQLELLREQQNLSQKPTASKAPIYRKPAQQSPVQKKTPKASRNMTSHERKAGAFPATQESDRSRMVSPSSNSRQNSKREGDAREMRPLSP